MQTSKEVTEGLRRLCGLVLGDDLQPDELRLRLSHCVQMVVNPVFSECEWDESKLVDSINKRLAKAGKSSSAIQFSRLCGKLREKDQLENRAGVLKFLLSLNQHSRRKEADPSLFRQSRTLASSSSSLSRDTPPSAGNTTSSTSKQQRSQFMALDRPTTPAWKRGQVNLVLHETTPTNNNSDSVMSSSQARSHPLAARQAFDSDSLHTPDCALLRDVMFALQGIDGQYFRFDPDTDSFQLASNAKLSNPKRALLLRVSEMGWLHGQVKTYCQQREEQGASDGLICQAFRSALQDELTEFYKQLAVLQSQVSAGSGGSQHHHYDQGISSPTTENGGHHSDIIGPSAVVTVRRLHVALGRWKQKLITLTSIVQACRETRGGALLSRLYKFVQHGDPDWRDVALKLLASSCRPLLMFVLKWIREGALDDRSDEFFVGCDNDVVDEAGVWATKYFIRDHMLPSFVPESVARTILVAGKSLNCIRHIVKDPDALESCLTTDDPCIDDVEAYFSLEPRSAARLTSLAEEAREKAGKRLIQVLDGQLLLNTHLVALKKYLLLSQGDFAWHLMDVLESELNKPVDQVRLHNLSGCLEQVVRQTNAQFEPAAVLDRLHVQALDNPPVVQPTNDRPTTTTTTTGWDIFSLKYRVDGPLRIVITDQCGSSYARLFQFVWRLKRLSFSLTSLWHGLVSASKTRPASLLQHQLHLASSEVARFVDCMQYYFLFQVLECSWHTFLNHSANSEDLDSIIASHQSYLSDLERKSFLTDQYSLLSQRFSTVLELVGQIRAFCQDYLDRTTENGQQVSQPVQAALRSRLLLLVKQYRETLKSFVTALFNQSDDDLRALGLRLDFTGFYTQTEPRV